jgi:hypothetical protein
MFMNKERPVEPYETIGKALRAVERQKQSLKALLPADAQAQRQALFHHLDAAAGVLFALVERAAEGKTRAVRVADVPQLSDRLQDIFRAENGKDFNEDMFNDWLLSKDLSHHFHADGVYLKW